jgi:hypothetical protein
MYHVGVNVAHLRPECKVNFQSLAGGPEGFDNLQSFIPEEIAARNGFIIPTRYFGAHRAALRRYGNRRNVEPES